MTDTTGLVPQPTYSPDTPLADLPRVIERQNELAKRLAG